MPPKRKRATRKRGGIIENDISAESFPSSLKGWKLTKQVFKDAVKQNPNHIWSYKDILELTHDLWNASNEDEDSYF